MDQNRNKKPWWAAVAHFAGHTFAGTLIFIIIAAPAVGLGFLVHALATYGVSAFTVAVLEFLEHAILVIDAASFLVYLVVTAIKAIREL